MRKAGITDYQAFALDILQAIPDRSISFEVFVDDLDEMVEQANLIAAWGENVMVKIPVTNTQGEFTGRIIKQLSAAGIPLNITAILTLEQVRAIAACLSEKTAAIVSVFAGRIADTGVDPIPLMQDALKILQPLPKAELLWASPRELLNVVQANEIGCHIITATNDILNKLHLLGKDLADYSLDTVKMFYKDAQAAGYQIMPLEEAV
jgi:transaldolase